MEINFTEAAGQLFPGALAYIVSVKLSGKERRGWFDALMEWAVYSWLIRFALNAFPRFVQAGETPVSITGMLAGDTLSFAVIVLLALLAGTAGAFLQRAQVSARIDQVKEGRWDRMSVGKKKTAKAVLWLAGLALVMTLISLPRIAELREQSRESLYKETAKSLFSEVKETVAEMDREGKDPDAFGDLEINGISIRQVNSDQRWVKGTGKPGYEAVYMVDQNGDLVYFSFRDEERASTWSGPTKDESFLEKNGRWNGGNGYGWTGYRIS